MRNHINTRNLEVANWSRCLHQEAHIGSVHRLISLLYHSAEERYVELLHFSIIEFAAVLGFLIFISPPVMNYSGVFPILFEYTEQNLTGGSSVYQAIFTEVNITLVETAFDFVDGFHRYSCLAQAGAQA